MEGFVHVKVTDGEGRFIRKAWLKVGDDFAIVDKGVVIYHFAILEIQSKEDIAKQVSPQSEAEQHDRLLSMVGE